MSWAHPGHILATSWSYLGHILPRPCLDKYWPHLSQILITSKPHPGHTLTTYCPYPGYTLWSYTDHILVIHWPQSWRHPDHILVTPWWHPGHSLSHYLATSCYVILLATYVIFCGDIQKKKIQAQRRAAGDRSGRKYSKMSMTKSVNFGPFCPF